MKTRRTILYGLLAVIFTLTLALAFTACESPTDDGTTPGGNTPTALAITTTSLPDGFAGVAYSETLTATGTAPITWSVDSGALPAGLTLAANGAITGTPASEGAANFTVKAANAAGSATQALSITVLPAYAALYGTWVSTTGTYQPYTLTISAGTVRWEISSGAAYVQYANVVWTAAANTNADNKTNYPNGYTFTGTRTSNSGSTVTIGFVALSADGQSVYVGRDASTASNVSGAGAIYTKAAPVITTASLPDGAVGAAYSQTLAATNPPVTWSLVSGALPAGLTLAATGAITGTPTAAGSSTFTVKAANDAGSDTKSFSITVLPAGSNTDPKAGLYGEWISTTGTYQPYIITITADTVRWETNNGNYIQYSNVQWTAAANANADNKTSYPNGFTFTGTRTTQNASVTLGFVALSADGKSVYLGINASTASNINGAGAIYTKATAATPVITTASLPNGRVGTAYSQTLTATGVPAWSLDSGALPAGLDLSASGVISGTPANAGTFTFTVKATNSAGSVTKELSITVFADTPPREVTIAMWDSRSDGWTGSSLRIRVNGTDRPNNAKVQTTAAQNTPSDQRSTNTYTFNVDTGDVVQIYWVGGAQYDNECAFAAYYTDYPPSPAFSPSSGTTDTVRVLASKRYNDPSGAVRDNTLMGSFTVSDITYTATANGSSTSNTTAIELYFSASFTGLTADDITITNGTGSATKGALTGYGTQWFLAVTNVTAGNITVRINKTGIESENKTVTVYKTTVPTSGITLLTENQWTTGSLSSSGEQWFRFTATASTQYIHAGFNGTLSGSSGVYVQVYDSSSALVGSETVMDRDRTNISRTLTSGQTYYIRVRPYNSSSSGSYRIAFNTSFIPPGFTPIPLTANQWADDSMTTTSGQQWFSFTATASTQYIHFAPTGTLTLTSVYVQVYDSSGATVESETNLYSSTTSTTRTLTNGQTYYIRVRPYYNNDIGGYRIAFNTSTTSPFPPTNATALTANQWANGNIPTAGGEQWFRFTATASTQNVHVSFNTLEYLSVRVYDSSGSTVGSETILLSSITSISLTLSSGQTYYIRVRPRDSTDSGTYRIAFSTTAYPPGTSFTQLNANQWANGNITTNGQQWFRFTATASTQYIHIEFGTLTWLYVQVYDDSGATVGYETELNSSTTRTSRTLTNGQTYYIKVRSGGDNIGNYRIAFNTSTTAPN